MPHPITQVQNSKKDRRVGSQVKELTGELVQQAALLKQLQEERDVLTAQHTILVSLCDSLYFLKENEMRKFTAGTGDQDAQVEQQQQSGAVLQAEIQRQRRSIAQEMLSSIEELLLLQQLAGIEYSCPHFRDANLPFLDLSADAYGADQPICPDEDPFLLMRFINIQAPHSQALTWQLADVMRHCSLSVPQLAMALARLEAGLTYMDMGPAASSHEWPCDSSDLSQGGDGELIGSNGASSSSAAAAAEAKSAAWVRRAGMGEHPIQTIQRIQIEWLRILGTLMDACKALIIMKLPTTNFDTGEVEKEPSKRRHMFAVRNLGLTEQQLQRLQVGFMLFQRLQGRLAEQQLHLQQQGALPSAIQASMPAAATAIEFNVSTGARLEAEQAAAAALNKLFQKQRVIAGMQWFYVIGTLSWKQFAKLRVLMSPFTQFGPMLQACILEYAAEVDRQQQQSQTQGKRKPGRS